MGWNGCEWLCCTTAGRLRTCNFFFGAAALGPVAYIFNDFKPFITGGDNVTGMKNEVFCIVYMGAVAGVLGLTTIFILIGLCTHIEDTFDLVYHAFLTLCCFGAAGLGGYCTYKYHDSTYKDLMGTEHHPNGFFVMCASSGLTFLNGILYICATCYR